jgi:multidrug efflux system membrane fusion protein
VLFNIDPLPFQAVLDQAKANHEKDEVLLAQYQLDLKRQTELLKGGASTQDELDQAKTAAAAQAAAIRADKAMIEKARIDLDNCTITCPIDGKAGDLLVTEGNLVKLNDVTLVTINQVKPIEVFFNVAQSDMNTVRQCMAKEALKIQAALPDEPGLPEAGDLFFVDNTVDINSGTIRLGARFPNDNERLWPGQYVLVNLRLGTLDNAIVVPSKAISAGREGKYVFVINPDNTAQTRAVTAGVQVGNVTVVEKGLQPGEMVVTDGQVKLTDGAKVEVQPDKAPIVATRPATQSAVVEAKP